jgi:hypothetical protein
MRVKRTLLILIVTAFSFLNCGENQAREFSVGPNVILVTLDGVRPGEFFNGTDEALTGEAPSEIFSYLWKNTIPAGIAFSAMVANPHHISLPAYQSIFAGAVQACSSNGCGRIRTETFPERLLRVFSWPRSQVAAIASWSKIANAFESNDGSTLVNAGMAAMKDPDTGKPVQVFEQLNKLQKEDAPNWQDARLDRYTMAHALAYLAKYRPRFLYVSLNDSDEFAHMANYQRYTETLREHDTWLGKLQQTLEALGEYGKRTTVIVTTDHGRGLTSTDWPDHGSQVPGSGAIWIAAKGPWTKKLGHAQKTSAPYTHLHLRPTIEKILGLKPCEKCLSPMEELIDGFDAQAE